MQEYKRAVFVVWGLFVLGALALTGCRSESRSRLAEATDRARRLYDKACSHLKDPVYRIGDKYAPLTEEAPSVRDAGAIKLVPHGMLNPLAGKAMDQGADELSEALGASTDAPAIEKVRAHTVLARIYALQGYQQAIEAARRRDRAWTLLRQTADAAIAMGDHGKRIANCDQLLAVSDPALDKMAAKAKADVGAAQTRAAALKKKVESLQKDKVSLTAANETLLAAARKLRVDSQLADVIKGIDLFDQAKAKEDEATRNSVRMTEIEDSMRFLASEIASLEMDISAAGKRSAAAGKIAADRKQRKADIRKKRQDFIKLLTEVQKQVETLAAQVVEVCTDASKFEGKALDAYRKADDEYEAYSKSTSAKAAGGNPDLATDPAIIALFGDVRMARGDLRVRVLTLQQRIEHVVGEVTRLWGALPVQKEVPDVLGQVSRYVADPAKTREDARNDFRWAAKNYEGAVKEVANKDLTWAYHLQVAAAYAGLYRVTADDDARRKGNDALGKLGDTSASPYVMPHAAYLRRVFSGSPATAPASAPAP